jgi:hypothetical protein
MILTGENRRTQGKTFTITTLSTTNPTLNNPSANPGLRGGRPATIRVSLCTAFEGLLQHLLQMLVFQIK